MFASEIYEELLNFFIDELLSIIGDQSVSNSKTADNVFQNEFLDIFC